MKKVCGECRWHTKEDISDGWVCTNDDSDYVSDWTDYNDTCEFWEKRK